MSQSDVRETLLPKEIVELISKEPLEIIHNLKNNILDNIKMLAKAKNGKKLQKE